MSAICVGVQLQLHNSFRYYFHRDQKDYTLKTKGGNEWRAERKLGKGLSRTELELRDILLLVVWCDALDAFVFASCFFFTLSLDRLMLFLGLWSQPRERDGTQPRRWMGDDFRNDKRMGVCERTGSQLSLSHQKLSCCRVRSSFRSLFSLLRIFLMRLR